MHFYTHYASYYLLNNVTFLNEKYAKIEKFKRTQATISMLMIMRREKRRYKLFKFLWICTTDD